MSASEIAKLRTETGAGVMDCKRAYEQASGDYQKALQILQDNVDAIAKKKAERATKQGIIEGYMHAGKVGVLLEINCESDFVAKNSEFKTLAHNIAMQIASMNPKTVEELLDQEYIMDPTMKISGYLNAAIGKIRENIQIKRFIRFELGEDK